MSQNLIVFLIVLVTAALIYFFVFLAKHHVSFAKRVLGALFVGIIFGLILQFSFGHASRIVNQAISWINIVGNGYIALLQMLVIPLVFISLVGAFTRLKVSQNLRKISITVLATLLITTAIAALIGIISVFVFHLQGANFINNSPGESGLKVIRQHQSQLKGQTLPDQIVSFLPTNIFADFAGTRATSTIAVVIFSLFVGVAFLNVRKNQPRAAATFARGINALQYIIRRIVRLVILLTPYGVLALMIKAAATQSIRSILNLGIFIIAAYILMC